jgi:hypothetical protein
MVDNSIPLCKPTSGQFFVMRQSGQAFSSRSEAPSECFCWHIHHSPRNMTLHSHLASMPLKRKLAARGKRAPRAPSIVGWFFRLPWLGYAADSVALAVYYLARVAARAPREVIREDAQSGNRLATTQDGPEAVKLVGTWPRYVLRELPRHVGWSDSPAR